MTTLAGVQYPGGKNGPGVAQRIINQIPPHDIFIEAFAGSAPIYRMKLPARATYLIESDPAAAAALQPLSDRATLRADNGSNTTGISQRQTRSHSSDADTSPGCHIINADAITWLAAYPFTGNEVVYCDPPYLMATRSVRTRRIYRHEISTASEPGRPVTDDTGFHEYLLEVLLAIASPIILSGYPSTLYASRLKGWRVIQFTSTTRGPDLALEQLWLNYDPPAELHDYRYVGSNHRERTDFRRMRERWTARLAKMTPIKRQALLAAIATSGITATNGPHSSPTTAGQRKHLTPQPPRE
jgi:DNA adenine methylase